MGEARRAVAMGEVSRDRLRLLQVMVLPPLAGRGVLTSRLIIMLGLRLIILACFAAFLAKRIVVDLEQVQFYYQK